MSRWRARLTARRPAKVWMTRRRLQLLALGLAIAGLAAAGSGLWLFAKAQLAQVMLHEAWMRTRAGVEQARPWPWADTWPVARLQAPDQQQDLIVLAGASGSTLAFGPGHLDGSARPGGVGNIVLVGHRDTHFAFLQNLAPGSPLILETPAGGRQLYRVQSIEIVHECNTAPLMPGAAGSQLTLITCYPFAAVAPGGPLRWVVRATAI